MSYSNKSAPPRNSYEMTVRELEQELDDIWPAWDAIRGRSHGLRARGKSFESLDPAATARLKWLLKRRYLLLMDKPRYGVLVVASVKDSGRYFAHPVPPLADGSPARPEAPPRVDSGRPEKAPDVFSLLSMALDMSLPIEVLETAHMAYKEDPRGVFDADWVRAWRKRG